MIMGQLLSNYRINYIATDSQILFRYESHFFINGQTEPVEWIYKVFQVSNN
jgi:hypothetical protein